MTFSLALLASWSAAGCADGTEDAQDAAPTFPEQTKRAWEPLRLASPAISADGSISAKIICRPAISWIPLEWGSAPPGAGELILYIGRYSTEVEGNRRVLRVPSASLVLGLDPGLEGVRTGAWPADAQVLRYRPRFACPAKREDRPFLFRIFAMAAGVRVKPSEVDGVILERLDREALAQGRLEATY